MHPLVVSALGEFRRLTSHFEHYELQTHRMWLSCCAAVDPTDRQCVQRVCDHKILLFLILGDYFCIFTM